MAALKPMQMLKPPIVIVMMSGAMCAYCKHINSGFDRYWPREDSVYSGVRSQMSSPPLDLLEACIQTEDIREAVQWQNEMISTGHVEYTLDTRDVLLVGCKKRKLNYITQTVALTK